MKAFYRLFYYISIVLTSILAGVTIAGAFVGKYRLFMQRDSLLHEKSASRYSLFSGVWH